MKIHEYQAKQLFAKYGVPVSQGMLIESSEHISDIKSQLETWNEKVFVVKAQVHSGGRGKAGGVQIAKTIEEAITATQKILGMTLVTKQTGPEGKVVQKVLIEPGSKILKEFYLSIIIDRKTSLPVLMVSTEGGMDIEEVAVKSPEKIIFEPISPTTGLNGYQIRHISQILSLKEKDQIKQLSLLLKNLIHCFIQEDASIVEINPLALTDQGLLAVDAKINIDDNALYRHQNLQAMLDPNEEDPKELEASKFDLSYISLDGNIGCMVNGAGLAMATMDIIKLHGGEPANFLDVGGSATKGRVTEAFKIILSDEKVQGILVNIFGGIMKCDVIAEGVVTAAKEVCLKVPLVVRLEGTNVEKGKEILKQSNLSIISATGMAEAAEKIVSAIKGNQ